MNEKTVLVLSVLGILYALELFFPFYIDRKGKGKHALKNLFLGFMNAALVGLLFIGALAYFNLNQENDFLLNIFGNQIMYILAVVLILDLWMYFWHVINHRVSFLWRFHLVHHLDPDVDVTSAFRFHFGEALLSAVGRIIIIILLSVPYDLVLLYEVLYLPVIMFHHSNVKIPDSIDRVFRIFFASPHMHRIHHSEIKEEADSNYGTLFSFWDRIFGTFRLNPTPISLKQGIKGYRDEYNQRIVKLMIAPFERRD